MGNPYQVNMYVLYSLSSWEPAFGSGTGLTASGNGRFLPTHNMTNCLVVPGAAIFSSSMETDAEFKSRRWEDCGNMRMPSALGVHTPSWEDAEGRAA